MGIVSIINIFWHLGQSDGESVHEDGLTLEVVSVGPLLRVNEPDEESENTDHYEVHKDYKNTVLSPVYSCRENTEAHIDLLWGDTAGESKDFWLCVIPDVIERLVPKLVPSVLDKSIEFFPRGNSTVDQTLA